MSSGKMQAFIPAAVKVKRKPGQNYIILKRRNYPPRKSAQIFDYLIFYALFCYLRITD